ncbi:MAG TPA: hypothetical protein VHB79_38010 [Polyangiaceae bacterium]|nr:hypothetical protein [Polyangiaceae bacterium]
MKRVLVLAGLSALAPGVAQAQIPVAPSPEPPAAAPAPPPAEQAPPPAEQAPPGDQYFVEPAPPAGEPAPAPPAAEPPPFEPPPPGLVVVEPPPPPPIHHLTPQNSLVLGARLGWFFPFGNLYAKAQPVSDQSGSGYVLDGVPWRDYASSGPMLELDAGVRLARSYTVFALWERAQLGTGNAVDSLTGSQQDHADTDFWAIGLRASSNPDQLGFITEVAVGYRRARTVFENDVEYQFTDAPFEARLGLGAELRLSRMTSLSALATVGVGGFGELERVQPNNSATPISKSYDQSDGHAWATINVGAHFDLIPSRN